MNSSSRPPLSAGFCLQACGVSPIAKADCPTALLRSSGTSSLPMTATEAEALLGQGFARAHRSVIVGLRHVTRVSRTAVFLTDGLELPLGRGMYDELNRALIAALREM